MPTDERVDRYYYIFDSRVQRALVLDRTTGEEVAWEGVPLVQLLDYVGEQRSAARLRTFARWCARQVGAPAVSPHEPGGRLWAVASEQMGEEARQVRANVLSDVVRAAALGLPQHRAEAAQLLTIHACTHGEARTAALDAAHMSERWAEFENDEAPAVAVRRMRQQQIDWLLDELRHAHSDSA